MLFLNLSMCSLEKNDLLEYIDYKVNKHIYQPLIFSH